MVAPCADMWVAPWIGWREPGAEGATLPPSASELAGRFFDGEPDSGLVKRGGWGGCACEDLRSWSSRDSCETCIGAEPSSGSERCGVCIRDGRLPETSSDEGDEASKSAARTPPRLFHARGSRRAGSLIRGGDAWAALGGRSAIALIVQHEHQPHRVFECVDRPSSRSANIPGSAGCCRTDCGPDSC